MWMRWCAGAMLAGLGLVVAGLGLGVDAQWGLVPCAACEGIDQGRLAVELSLLGLIVASLSTAGVAAILMRAARPRGRDEGAPASRAPLPAREPPAPATLRR